ncbi:uncharacterized protein LOC127287997 isoform X2 [Leptopilina boulardi]|uniref:uncharacterized protein LOC127287997 isoform X2 n=1 Tax=Leptopilina boulardi TaxID=63433 RepID=UPI0021F51340|nr:uncharacterized protein LOC127287997 isoform X2 [Leptopilina boulardi]
MSRVRSLLTCSALLTLTVLLSRCLVNGSEFPERECCDPIYPIPEPTSKAPSAPTPTGRSGSDIKAPIAILNCLFARQLCFDDSSCSAILEIIPRVCGPELVACSTVTVSKCQAALKTLQAFSFFRPTCLCREPHVDPECNNFRDFLFDHPCIYVLKKDKEAGPIDTLPNCNHALSVCQREKSCTKLFEDFKSNCKARDGKCRIENRDACHDAWTQLRKSPMFGCICPNNHMKRRCDRIFSVVNHNPCIEFVPSSASIDLSGTDSALYPFNPQEENLHEIWLPPTSMYPYFLFPGTASTRNTGNDVNDFELFEGARHHRTQHRYHEVPELPGSPGLSPKINSETFDPYPDIDEDRTSHEGFTNHHQRTKDGEQQWKWSGHEGGIKPKITGDTSFGSSNSFSNSFSPSKSSNSFSPSSSSSSSSSSVSLSKHDRASSTEHLQPHENEHGVLRHNGTVVQDMHHHHQEHRHRHHHNDDYPALPQAPPPPSAPSVLVSPPARPTPTVDEINPAPSAAHGTKKFAPRPTYEHGAIIDHPDNDLDEFRIERLPVDRFLDLPAFDEFVGQVKYISHPDNSTTLEVESQLENPLIDVHQQDFNDLRKFPIPEIHHHRTHHRKNHSNDEQEPGLAIPSSLPDSERIIPQPTKVILTSTCHHAYASCKNDPDCRALLQPVLNHCDQATCARNECMDALQYFYKSASHKHSVEIAFCLCKTNDEKRNDCTVAKEKMHPQCAQRPEGPEIPTCHSLAELCRDERSCRSKLEFYEQSCAVDSVTKKCAGSTSVCREALLGILGTELRTTCACKGTDLSQIYDCVGWQRLLWVNPCVVESQKDYHARRKHHLHPRTTTISAMSTTRAVTATTESVIVAEVEDNVIPEITTRQSTTETTTTEFVELTTTSVVTTPSTTTTSTTPPRYCVVERGRQSHQYIREGKGKRLYRDDEPDCSELCQCGEGEVLICNTICVKSSPCKTDFAYYNHAAPAYQAYRGRCLCYSGRFICMRPSPDAYSIPHGVFMFLGYSETDETLLRPHNNLTVLDAVSSLDSFMREEVNNQTVCTLFLYNVTKENVIAAVRLGTDNPPPNISESQNLQHLLRVKEECASMLQDLSDKINNKHQEVHTHPLLSIFKMAEVEVKLPLTSKATTLTSKSSTFFLGLTLLISGFLQRTTTSMLISTFTDDLIS